MTAGLALTPSPWFGQPRGLTILFLTNMWEQFSYYGMRALLVYYMTRQLLLAQGRASVIYGTYTACAYFTPILGGIIADRWLSKRRAIIIGASIMAAGHFMMTFEPLFYAALATIALGNGLFLPTLPSQIDDLYAPGDPRRPWAYNVYYVGINIGGFLAPLVCGTVGELYGWHYGFGIAGFSMLAGLLIYVWGQRYLPTPRDAPVRRSADPVRVERQTVLLLIALALCVTKADALKFLAAQQGFAGRNPDVFALIGTVADLDRAKAERRIGIIMGLQNADQFEIKADVALFHGLGLRCAQLTYNTQNLVDSGCAERVDGGVTDYGVEIITEMHTCGMLVDVSHSGDRTTLDGIEFAPGAIAITHSNCRALSHHPRGKTDEAIVALARKYGVIGISGVRQFVSDREPTTLGNIVDHIEHVAKLVGVEHVGIGSDADLNGYDDLPPGQYKMLKGAYKSSDGFRDKIDIEGLDSPLKMFNLTEEMLRRGWSNANDSLVLGGNFRRLLAAAWTPSPSPAATPQG